MHGPYAKSVNPKSPLADQSTANGDSKLPVSCLVPHAQAFPSVDDCEEDSGTGPSTLLIEDKTSRMNLVGSRPQVYIAALYIIHCNLIHTTYMRAKMTFNKSDAVEAHVAMILV